MRLGFGRPSSYTFGVALAFAGTVGCAAPAGDLEDREPVVGSSAQALDLTKWVLPPEDAATRTEILKRYTKLDPDGIVPRGLLEDAIEYFDLNKSLIANQKFITVVDFTKFSGEKRFFIVDMESGKVEPHNVAHGSGSDPDWTGYAKEFSNISGSSMSSLGFYLTTEIYDGTHKHSMRLEGLSADGSPNEMANSKVLSRLVVVHEADYVSDSKTTKQGRSNGCFALDPEIEPGVVDRLAHGSLIYASLKPLHPMIGKAIPEPPAKPPAEAGEPAKEAPPAIEAPSGARPAADDSGCSIGRVPTTAGTDAWAYVAVAIGGLVLQGRRRRRAA